MMEKNNIRLTQFSHGAGCGCKISPAVLDIILKNNSESGAGAQSLQNKNLLVGNSSRDDAAVYDLGNGTALISTTDFFLPIVDDAFNFGRIASANAISDVYAMGGTPILAIAILGWPIDKIAPEIAGDVVAGAKALCSEANIPLAGGHSIDSPEPIFGLAVNGIVDIKNLKRNDTAKEGDLLFFTKPLGTGILSTASKKGLIKESHLEIAVKQMSTLNKAGLDFGKIKEINALTDVTGFGLLGHLCEMANGSNLTAEISFDDVPLMDDLMYYLQNNCIPGGTGRNWKSYGHQIDIHSTSLFVKELLCDPQTSGGLLVSVAETAVSDFMEIVKQHGLDKFAGKPIGKMKSRSNKAIVVI